MFHFDQFHAPAAGACFMGVVNVTPDSFSDGGTFLDPAAAARHARTLAAQGAAILDLGAEASSFFRAGVRPVAAEEQLRRLLPVLGLLRNLPMGAVISVDTRSAEVAREALGAGAAIINDISAGEHDPEMLRVVAERGAGIVLMHMSAGYPATPAADDGDIVGTVREYLARRARAARAAGIAPERIAVDPGLGFGKTMADNWRLALAGGGGWGGAGETSGRYPVVVGASRKRFLETPVPGDVEVPAGWEALVRRLGAHPLAAHPRDGASAALARLTGGVAIHRIHNVALAAGEGVTR